MLSGRQQRAIAALINSSDIRTAAAQAQVGYQTLRGWLSNNQEFQREYRDQLAQLVSSATAQLQKNMAGAIQVMASIMCDENVSPQSRLNAADAILRNSLKYIEAVDILNRLQEIEERINADGDN